MLDEPQISKVKTVPPPSLLHLGSECYSVIITPRKKEGKVRATIIIPQNLRTGNIIIESGGRFPRMPPPLEMDDLRPLQFYVFGKGSLTYKVFNQNDFITYKMGVLTFD